MNARASRARLVLHAAFGCLVALLASITHAQDRYPSRSVDMIVPWGPGGGADILGRLVAKWLEGEFKSPFPVINLPGATGSIGLQKMVASGADAHAIGVLTGDTLTMAAFADSPVKLGEIVALGVMIRQPSGLFAKGDGRFKTWADVIAAAKAKPGTITVAITGANSPDEATVNYLGSKGIRLVGVPYPRPGERYTAVLGGHVDLLYEQAGDIKGNLDAKAMRPLIFFATQRLPAPFADVPVSAEFGYEVLLPQMRAIVARAGADPRRLEALSASIGRFAATPEFANYLRDQYALPDSYIPMKDAQRFLEGEIGAFQKLQGGSAAK
jgi:tripartite-type tricarboxylate transporter receptor subunit TctC